MHVHGMEIAPLAPLLIPVAEVAGWYLVIGVIAAVSAFTVMLVWVIDHTVGGLPFGIGNLFSSAAHGIEQKITSALGGWASSVDAKIGAAQHELARVIDWLGHEINSHANLIATLAQLVLGSTVGAFYANMIRTLFHRSTVQAAQIETLTRTLTVTDARSAHAHGEVVLPRIKGLERGFADVIEHDIAGLRSRARTTENSLSRLWHRIKGLDKIIVTTAFVGAVSVALARMGLGALRCSSLRNVLNKVGCGGWKLLEELLAGVIDVLVIADLCQLTKTLIQVAESREVQGVLSGVIGGIDELLLCQGVTRPVALDGYWTDPPPVQPFAALPAV